MSLQNLCDPPRPVAKKPKVTLPKGACDCHFHIFDAPSHFVEERFYTPPRASLSDYKNLQKTLGIERSVIIQPSIYGCDNRTILSTCHNDDNMKAVIVIDSTTSLETLRHYADNYPNIVGCRLNLLFSTAVKHGSLTELIKKIADFNWHLQILADISRFEQFESLISTAPIPIVFDHLGHISTSLSVNHHAYQSFLRALSEGLLWVKLSAPYRITCKSDCHYDDVEPFVTALLNANPEQLLWGTDWPHPQSPTPLPDETDMLNQFLEWIASSDDRQKIFVDNPARFYGF